MAARNKSPLMISGIAAVSLLAGASTITTSHADTLGDALARAYATNPILTGARAAQRATDEDVAIQKADGRPNAGGTIEYEELIERASPFSPARSGSASASVSVPLYMGGTVRNAVNAAKLRAEAGRNDLRGTEASLFSSVVAAYMDVIRDSAVVALNRQNVEALAVNLQASSDRFEVGDVTRTDVAQSNARLELARASLQEAEARLIGSRENYIALVGTPPVNLETPPPLPGLPASPEDAVAVALRDNPDIAAAQKSREAARYDTKAAKGGILPQVSAFAQGSRVDYLGSEKAIPLAGRPDPTVSQATVGATLRLPLYQGGRPAALARRSAAREAQAIEGAIATERNVIAQVRASYASWQASLRNIASTRSAVDATALSLEGVQAENSVGTRTILDILNAEQEALNARVQLVTAERNAYVAGFTLLAAMGRAEARDLNLEGGALYDPLQNYNRVEGKWIDFDFDPSPQAQATRTDGTPAQTADVPANATTPDKAMPPAR